MSCLCAKQKNKYSKLKTKVLLMVMNKTQNSGSSYNKQNWEITFLFNIEKSRNPTVHLWEKKKITILSISIGIAATTKITHQCLTGTAVKGIQLIPKKVHCILTTQYIFFPRHYGNKTKLAWRSRSCKSKIQILFFKMNVVSVSHWLGWCWSMSLSNQGNHHPITW